MHGLVPAGGMTRCGGRCGKPLRRVDLSRGAGDVHPGQRRCWARTGRCTTSAYRGLSDGPRSRRCRSPTCSGSSATRSCPRRRSIPNPDPGRGDRRGAGPPRPRATADAQQRPATARRASEYRPESLDVLFGGRATGDRRAAWRSPHAVAAGARPDRAECRARDVQQLLRRFPPRTAAGELGRDTGHDRDRVLARLLAAAVHARCRRGSSVGRRRGLIGYWIGWPSQPGDTWQDRWLASRRRGACGQRRLAGGRLQRTGGPGRPPNTARSSVDHQSHAGLLLV